MEFKSWPSIDQFRQVITYVKQKTQFKGFDENGERIYNPELLPTIEYIGTVKLHGTNGALVASNGEYGYQNRTKLLTPGVVDNFGFATALHQKKWWEHSGRCSIN